MKGRLREPEVFVRDAVLLKLTRDEIPPGDAELFFFRISRDFNDLHPIPQSGENRIHEIRGGDEHHLGEIKGNTQVMVAEGVVLFRVQDLEQRG